MFFVLFCLFVCFYVLAGSGKEMYVAGSSAVCSQANKREDHSSFSKIRNQVCFVQADKISALSVLPLSFPILRTHT